MKRKKNILLGIVIMALLVGCGNKTEQADAQVDVGTDVQTVEDAESVGMANPMTETTLEEINQYYPVTLPEATSEEQYYFIKNTEENPLAQIDFTYDTLSYTYRILGTTEDNDISGMYVEWDETLEVEVGYNIATISLNEGKEGMIIWYDAAPGLKYTIIMETDATAKLLENMANLLYIPAQGDAQ